jgi:2-oxoisovalerate dehydrogenase E2 component (dihydrolipoyl transacylase)
MAVHVIKVPDVGEGIAEVELVDWHVAPGDTVQEDQALADVMTDKASVEIPSPVAGRVLDLGAAVGQMMAVGAVLIRIETGAAQASGQVPAAAPIKPVATPPAGATHSGAGCNRAGSCYGAGCTATAAGTAAGTAPAARPSTASPSAGHAIASPALRRRAWELGVDLNQVTATGTAGRVTQADLDAFVAAGGAQPLAPARAAAPSTAREDEEAIPVIGLRRRIALQMQESKRRIPHFSYVEEVDVTELEATRAALNAKWAADRGKLTLLPLLMRAVVLAVRDFGLVNARFDDEKGVVTRYGAVHIGVATDTRHGLLVPVVRHCEARSLWDTAAELSRLAQTARAGRATRAELSGSTITISSLGALGGIVSTPVINRPEVAIIGVNRMVERPMLRGGAVVARQMMNLSSSFDHRVVDGIDAARFIQAVRQLLETPALLFVDAA